MIIRKAQEEDVGNLIELMQLADKRERTWAEKKANGFVMRANGSKSILVAEDEQAGRLAGYIGLKEYEDNQARQFVNLDNLAWITWIAVLFEYRHQDIGSKLLSSADNFAKRHGKSGVVLDCRGRVIPFYVKNGYKVVGQYSYRGAPRYVLERKL